MYSKFKNCTRCLEQYTEYRVVIWEKIKMGNCHKWLKLPNSKYFSSGEYNFSEIIYEDIWKKWKWNVIRQVFSYFPTLSTFNPKILLLIFISHLFSADKTLKKMIFKMGEWFSRKYTPLYLPWGWDKVWGHQFVPDKSMFPWSNFLNGQLAKHRITWRNTLTLLFQKKDVFLKQKLLIILRIEKSMKTWLARIQKQT